MDYVEFFKMLQSWGLLDIILPFMLITTILYAVFTRTKVLGDRRAVNITVSAAAAALVVMGHVIGAYPAEWDVVNVLNYALPHIGLVFIASFAFLLIIGVLGIEAKTLVKFSYSAVILVFSVFYVYFAFPEIFGFYVGLAALLGLHSWVFSDRPYPITLFIFMLVVFIFHAGTGFPKTIPTWLQFVNNTTFQVVSLVLFIILISVRLVADKKRPEKSPVETYLKTKEPKVPKYILEEPKEEKEEKPEPEPKKEEPQPVFIPPKPEPQKPIQGPKQPQHPEYAGRPEARKPKFEFG